MLISMFNKGNFKRSYGYSGDDNEPTMAVNNHAAKSSALIPLPAAYKYNEPESKDQKGMTAIFDTLRKMDKSAMLSHNASVTKLALQNMAGEDLQFGIALELFRMAISLDVSQDNSSLFSLREFIADGLDDLVKMKPYQKSNKAVAEYEAVVDGQKFSGEMTE